MAESVPRVSAPERGAPLGHLALLTVSLALVLAALAPLAAAETEPGILPVENWPKFRKDAPNTGASINDAPEDESLYWVVTEPMNPNFAIGYIASAAVVDGVIYVGSTNGHLYGFDEASGSVIWDFEAPEFSSLFGPFPIWSSPAVDQENGLIYVAIDNLYALDMETAEVVWEFETDFFFEYWSSPTFEDGVVYFGDVSGFLHAIEATTGNEIWSFETGEREYNPFTEEEINKEAGGSITATPAIGPELVYIVDWDENLYAVDKATGELIFIQGFEETVPGTNVPLEWGPIDMAAGDGMASVTLDLDNEMLFVGDTAGNFWAMWMDPDNNGLDDDGDGKRDNEGHPVWKYTTGDAISSSAALYQDNVYVASWDQNLYAFNPASGQIEWQQSFEGFPWGSVTAADGKIFFGTINYDDEGNPVGWLYALDAESGEVVWSFNIPDWFLGTPTPYNGKLFVGDFFGNHFAAFGPDGPKPDLYIEDVTISDEFDNGQRIIYTTFGNKGGTRSPPAELLIYVDDELEYNRTFDTLQAGEMAAANIKIELGGGGHEVTIKITQRPTAWYHILEINTDNNELTETVGGVVDVATSAPVMFSAGLLTGGGVALGLVAGGGGAWWLARRGFKIVEE